MNEASIVSFEDAGGCALGRVTCPHVSDREAGVISDEGISAANGAGYKVVLDLGGVMMITSAGLGALITLSKACRSGGGSLALFGLNGELQNLLSMTRLDKLLVIRADEASALKAVSK